jgi:hypothetical protein
VKNWSWGIKEEEEKIQLFGVDFCFFWRVCVSIFLPKNIPTELEKLSDLIFQPLPSFVLALFASYGVCYRTSISSSSRDEKEFLNKKAKKEKSTREEEEKC